MAAFRRGPAALLIVAAALAAVGCSAGGGSSIDDSEIVAALNLKQAGAGYEMNGDPFCRVDQLLNDVDEVNGASEQKGVDFVIAAPGGEVGVLAHPPFAPRCKRDATAALKKLARQPNAD